MQAARRVALMVVASVVVSSSAALAEDPVRLQQFGTREHDEVFGLATGPAGSVEIFGSTFGAFEGFTAAGGTDAFIRGYDPGGVITWTEQFGTAGDDAATSAASDAEGALYVVGIVGSALPGETSRGGYDAFIRKYRIDGSVGWTKQLGTEGYDVATGVVVRGNSLYVASLWGERNSSRLLKLSLGGRVRWTRQVPAGWHLPVATDASGVYVAGSVEVPDRSGDGYDLNVFLRKYDHRGAPLWTRRISTAEIEQPLGLDVGAGGVYLAGHTRGSIGAANLGQGDAFVRRYTAGGAKRWTRQWGTTGSDWAWDVDVSDSTREYVVGFMGSDAFVTALDPDGATLWTHVLTTDAREEGRGVALVDGSLHVAGSTGGRLDGSHGAPTGQDGFLATFNISV